MVDQIEINSIINSINFNFFWKILKDWRIFRNSILANLLSKFLNFLLWSSISLLPTHTVADVFFQGICRNIPTIGQMFHSVVHFSAWQGWFLIRASSRIRLEEDILPSTLSCPEKWDYWAVINVQTLSFRIDYSLEHGLIGLRFDNIQGVEVSSWIGSNFFLKG